MYDDHYGLAGRPFQLTPDPKFWFETATHRKAMAYLGYGLAQGEGFIVVTGDIGAGKTTLMGHLVGTLDPQAVNVIKIVSTAIEADDLLRIVATQFGMDPANLTKAQLLTVIERGLHAVARTGRRTLLVVDEAQALPVSALEELRMLSNFQAGGHALVQIVLLGQPEFRDRLHGSDHLEQLRQRVIAIHHLDPMGEHEVADYIAHRLSVVGWQGRPDFAADAFEALYRGSGGVPRRLNLLAGRVMLHAAMEELPLIDAGAVRHVLRDLHADLPLIAIERPVEVDPVEADPSEEGAGKSWPIGLADIEPVAAVSPPDLKPEPQPTPAEPPLASDDRPRRRFIPRDPRWLLPEAASPVDAAEPVPPVSNDVADEPGVEEPDPVDTPARHDPAIADDRLAALEARIEQQDAALRRVLTLLVDWVEADKASAHATAHASAAAAPTAGYTRIRPPAAWDDAA